jgi:hypothetical protein
MIRVTKQGDPRILHTYYKFKCGSCKCEFIADESDYKTTQYDDIFSASDGLDPLGLEHRIITMVRIACPCCGTYIDMDLSKVEKVSYKEIVKFDEKEYQKRMDLLL